MIMPTRKEVNEMWDTLIYHSVPDDALNIVDALIVIWMQGLEGSDEQ